METELALSKKFQLLFNSVMAPDSSSHTLTEVSETTGIALNTLSRLKTGRIEDPRLSTLLLISNFFGISLDYFRCQTEEDCVQFLMEEQRRHSTVPQIALRVREMSHDVLAEIGKMVDYIEYLEGSGIDLTELLEE